MGRPNRLLIKDGIYHVYNRANNYRSINLSEGSYSYFLSLLSTIKTQFKVTIYAYALMTNHFHILIKNREANLDKAMKFFGENYATHINKHNNASGPVFKGRYRSKLVQDEIYFLQLLRYIHLNPFDGNLDSEAPPCSWTSMDDYLNDDRSLIDIKEALSRFINLNDFIHYHSLGNSKEIERFYLRRRSSSIINSESMNPVLKI